MSAILERLSRSLTLPSVVPVVIMVIVIAVMSVEKLVVSYFHLVMFWFGRTAKLWSSWRSLDDSKFQKNGIGYRSVELGTY